MEHEELPLDERFRRAEQYSFDFDSPRPQQPPTQVESDWQQCPYHQNVFVSGCKFCNPRWRRMTCCSTWRKRWCDFEQTKRHSFDWLMFGASALIPTFRLMLSNTAPMDVCHHTFSGILTISRLCKRHCTKEVTKSVTPFIIICMTYKDGAWGEKAKKRSQKRKNYFLEYQRRKNANKPKFIPKGCIKKNARQRVRDHVLSGKIVRPSNCEKCGKNSKIIEAHHEDYSKPLQIIWLCKRCHIEADKKRKTWSCAFYLCAAAAGR